MKSWWRPFLPVEHGAWGVFICAFLLGAFSGVAHPMATPAILIASLGFFLLRNPLLLLLRSGFPRPDKTFLAAFPLPGWLACASLILIGSVPLIALERWLLAVAVAAAIAALVLEAHSGKSNPRSRMISEVVNVLTVSLIAPAASYAATGVAGWRELTLWVLCTVYFGVTTIDVRWRIAKLYSARGLAPLERAQQAHRERRTTLAAAVVCMAAFLTLAPVPWAVSLAFVPLVYRVWRPTGGSTILAADLRRLGWQEVRLSMLFTGLGAALVRFQ